MKLKLGFLVLLLFIGALSASAQESQCLEVWDVWSNNTRYEVNLDTGAVVSYTPITPTRIASSANRDSFDGRYTAQLEQNYTLGEGYRVTLIDNSVGVSFLLEEYAVAVSWSPNSSWLVYIQIIEEGVAALVLFNADGGESISAALPEVTEIYLAAAFWSPDGSFLTVAVNIIGDMPSVWALQFYTVPDLTLMNSYEVEAHSPSFSWSPSRRYLAMYSSVNGSLLVDTQSQETYPLTIDPIVLYRFYWSPDETYLVTSHVNNDWTDAFDVVNMQGEYLLENILISADYDDSRANLDWVDDHRLIASTFIFDTAMSNLTLFNLQTGDQQLLLPHLYSYRLSHDRRYIAATGQNETGIQLFDLSAGDITAANVPVTTEIDNFIWREDRYELLVLFEDRWLRGYDFEAGTWRDIAIVPTDEQQMRVVPCTQ